MSTEISNNDDTINSRDIIERIEELEAEDVAPYNASGEHFDGVGLVDRDTSADENELYTLKGFAEEGEGYAGDWIHGVTLIRDTYFQTYAEELATDCCEVPSAGDWPI